MAFPQSMPEALEDQRLNLAAEILRSGGTVRMKVLGTSMLPSIWPGDVLKVESMPHEAAVSGDIVLALRGGRFFVHRLIGKSGEPGSFHWTTRGDSLPQDDPPVPAAQLLGRVSAIHRKDRWIVPGRRLSPRGRVLAWILCRSNSVRIIALQMHSWRASQERLRRFLGGAPVTPAVPFGTQASHE